MEPESLTYVFIIISYHEGAMLVWKLLISTDTICRDLTKHLNGH